MSIGFSLNRVLVMVCAVLFSCTAIHAKECGVRPTKLAIINGTFAYENEFPWQAALWRSEQFSCGGTILSDTWILTAGYCVQIENEVIDPKNFSVMVGSLSIKTPSNNSKVIKVKRVVLHPQFNKSSSENDLALLELAQPIGLDSSELNAICLGKPEHQTEGISAVISGYGLNEWDKFENDHLKRAIVEVDKNEVCKKNFNQLAYSIVCTGKNFPPCNRDSGGPLQYELDGRWYQLGVMLNSKICINKDGPPSISTRVPYYLDFIKQITGITPP